MKHAWQRSFGNQEHASKTIASCGWNPLNYCLLDHPALKKVATPVVDLTKPTSNISVGLGYHYIDKLIEEERRNEGQLKKFKEAKESLKNEELKAEKLAMITKVSSSILAVNNHHVLDKGVLTIVEKNENEEDALKKKKESETRKSDLQKKADDKKKTNDYFKCVTHRHSYPPGASHYLVLDFLTCKSAI